MGKVSLGDNAVEGEMLEEVSVLASGATPALDASKASLFTLTPAENETLSATNVTNGELIHLVVTTSGTTSYTLTFGTGFKATGTLATGVTSGKVFVVTFLTQNNLLTEVSRTTAM